MISSLALALALSRALSCALSLCLLPEGMRASRTQRRSCTHTLSHRHAHIETIARLRLHLGFIQETAVFVKLRNDRVPSLCRCHCVCVCERRSTLGMRSYVCVCVCAEASQVDRLPIGAFLGDPAARLHLHFGPQLIDLDLVA